MIILHHILHFGANVLRISDIATFAIKFTLLKGLVRLAIGRVIFRLRWHQINQIQMMLILLYLVLLDYSLLLWPCLHSLGSLLVPEHRCVARRILDYLCIIYVSLWSILRYLWLDRLLSDQLLYVGIFLLLLFWYLKVYKLFFRWLGIDYYLKLIMNCLICLHFPNTFHLHDLVPFIWRTIVFDVRRRCAVTLLRLLDQDLFTTLIRSRNGIFLRGCQNWLPDFNAIHSSLQKVTFPVDNSWFVRFVDYREFIEQFLWRALIRKYGYFIIIGVWVFTLS